MRLLIYFFLVISFGCSKNITPAATTQSIPITKSIDVDKVLNKKSTFIINYSIANKGLIDTFEYFVDSIYALDWTVPEYDIKTNLKRSGPMKVELSGKDILVELPTNVYVSKSTFLGDIKANGEVKMKFVAKLDIDTNWMLKINTKLIEYDWIKEPKLSAGVISIPFESISNRIFDRLKPMIEKGIDDGVKQSFNLRAMIMDVTKEWSEPYQLHQIYGGWLYMVPDSTFLTGITNRQGVSLGKLAITAKTIVTSTKPNKANFPKIPKLKWLTKLPDSSNLNLQMDLTYAYLDSIAKEGIVGQSFEEDGKKIKIERVKVGPLGSKLSISMIVSGSFNGELVVVGSPVYEKGTRTIKAQDIDISVRTNNILHKAAAFLLKGKMKSELEKTLNFPIESKIKAAQIEIDAMTDTYYSPYKMQVQARLGEPDLPVFFPMADKLTSTISMNMYVSVLFRDLSFFQQ